MRKHGDQQKPHIIGTYKDMYLLFPLSSLMSSCPPSTPQRLVANKGDSQLRFCILQPLIPLDRELPTPGYLCIFGAKIAVCYRNSATTSSLLNCRFHTLQPPGVMFLFFSPVRPPVCQPLCRTLQWHTIYLSVHTTRSVALYPPGNLYTCSELKPRPSFSPILPHSPPSHQHPTADEYVYKHVV